MEQNDERADEQQHQTSAAVVNNVLIVEEVVDKHRGVSAEVALGLDVHFSPVAVRHTEDLCSGRYELSPILAVIGNGRHVGYGVAEQVEVAVLDSEVGVRVVIVTAPDLRHA